MTEKASYNDKPISQPSEDRFGIYAFAKALAEGILKITAPDGTVVALNGPWGAGKSSAVNLILHHLSDPIDAEELAVVNFACWWFRGEEALALAFFRELYAGLGPSLGTRFKKAMPKLGARLLNAGGMVGPAIDLAGGSGAGTIASGAMNWMSGLIKQDDTVEKLYDQISKSLKDQDRRFLIVIDDIDRLAPDEALLIFRLVKSVGKLPNVIYLLVFDRTLAEAIVRERYPSEGPQYLEKIIQASFDIPEPRKEDLRSQMLERIGAICGSPRETEMLRFMNVFYDVVAPEIRTPRDVNRLANSLAVSWPAIGAEVDRADFVGLETIRLLQPSVYRGIRANKDRLVGKSDSSGGRFSQSPQDEYDQLLLGSTELRDRERLRRGLKRLFPKLESIWGNLHYGDDSLVGWERERRVCASSRFDSYFRLSISDDVLKKDEIDILIERATDQQFIKDTLRKSVQIFRAGGTTKAALILDELNLHSQSIPDEAIQPLLTAIFDVADEIDNPSDVARGFSIGDNLLRIHWLLRRLTLERFDINRRSAIIVNASRNAPLGWLVDLATSAYSAHYPRGDRTPEPEQRCITNEQDAVGLQSSALKAIQKAARNGLLVEHSKLAYLLYRWRDLAADDGRQVKRWAKAELTKDHSVVLFARALTSHGWSQSIEDRVARRTTMANVTGLEEIMDPATFRKRAESLLTKSRLADDQRDSLLEFLGAWRRHDEGRSGR